MHGAALHGTVHGGQQPIVGAHVYLFAAGTMGYGGASTSLLNAASTGNSDSVGAYVLTDSNGNFSLTGDYTCTANTQVYMLTLGGNPGSGANSAAALMAVLGNCPASGTLAGQVPTVLINEISTVAAAYAFAGFATDATHVGSSGTTQAQTGIANAFANAAQMYSLSQSNGALAVTPAGNGTVPQAEIHTLANILASCINSIGPASPTCTALFTNAVNGSTQPTETATAAINIAHHPGANVTALFALASANSPFMPQLPTQPNDFSITLAFAASNVATPKGIAADSTGSIWFTNSAAHGFGYVTPTGAIYTLSDNSATFVGAPQGIAIDPSGNVWYNDNSLGYISYYTPSSNNVTYINFSSVSPVFQPYFAIDPGGNIMTTGTSSGTGALFYYTGSGYSYSTSYNMVTSPAAIATDSNGYFWITSNNSSTTSSAKLEKFKRIGTPSYATCTGTNYARGSGVAVDNSNNVWVSDIYTSDLVKFANSCSYSASYPTVTNPVGVAMDGSSSVWTVNNAGRLGGKTNAGVDISPSAGYSLGYSGTLVGPVVDLSGNVWVASTSGNQFYEVLGAATPVAGPLSVAAASGKLGAQP